MAGTGHVAPCDLTGPVVVDYGDEVGVAEADVVDGDADDVLDAHAINLVMS